MAFVVTAEDIAVAKLHDIPLRIAVEPHGGQVQHIVIRGLPKYAELTSGTAQTDGSWQVAPADLAQLKLNLSKCPNTVIEVEITAEGTANHQPAAAVATFHVAAIPRSSRTSTWEKIWMAIALLVFTASIFSCWRLLYASAQHVLTADWSVPWTQSEDVWLSPGPITFWYDPAKKELHHRGPIDSALKLQLLSLARAINKEPESGAKSKGGEEDAKASVANGDPRLASYNAAIDRLAYDSNGLLARYFLYLLSIAGLSGVLGTQIRAFANFIYISTTRNELNLSVWWPWYLLRPVLGFLLGLMAVLLVEAKLFSPTTDSAPSGTAWWMAFAMLVGFAADDFARRLRLVGQALFGKDK